MEYAAHVMKNVNWTVSPNVGSAFELEKHKHPGLNENMSIETLDTQYRRNLLCTNL